MVKARKYVVTNFFQDLPKIENYEIVTEELPAVQNGDILVKTEWISVEPYIFFFGNETLPYDQFGFQVGMVEDSKDSNFPVGTRVVSHKGWCDYYMANPNLPSETPQEKIYKVPDLKGLSPSLCVGTVGMPGATAYYGVLEICKPKPGETLVVTGAAGAVGSIAGQIGKIAGCRVIGFAGSDEKVRFLEEEFGFDKAFNYKTVDVAMALKTAAPNGVDCFFDNVGGEISCTIINYMNSFGRVAACGSISAYETFLPLMRDNPFLNKDLSQLLPKATIIQPAVVSKQLKIEAFLVWRWIDCWPEAFAKIIDWIKSGQLKHAEHVTEGFDKLCDAARGLFRGENIGKAVVKLP